MRLSRITMPCASFAFAMLSTAGAHADTSPLGVWIDHTGRGAVEIIECDGKLCGRVAWTKDAGDAKDCGKQIIGNVAPVGKNKWDNGWIYDPDRGRKFDVELTALDNGKLRVKGYAGTKWLSETFTWKRAPADLQTCAAGSNTEASAPQKPDAAAKSETAKADTDTKPAPGAVTTPDPLNAANADDAQKPAAATDKNVDAKKPAVAKAEPSDDNDADDAPQGGGKGRVLARLMNELESGDGPVKLKRTGKTCKVTAPYVGVISFPCDRDND